jgi:NAD(P)H-hydrate epimerase
MLTSRAAAALDAELLSLFSLDQLMELAGHAAAVAVAELFPLASHPRVLLLCGPGNNGGDGLVCARHLASFGYSPRCVVPKRPRDAASPSGALFQRLLLQLQHMQVPVAEVASLAPAAGSARDDVIVDALFGFSFDSRGGIREPFAAVLAELAALAAGTPVLSIDVPSGWPVDGAGAGSELPPSSLRPAALLSLTAPKPCSAAFSGAHFLGLRCLPPELAARHGLDMQALWKHAPAASPIVRLS